MNHRVPDWDMDYSRSFPDLPKGDWFSSQQKKSMGSDHELVELLWRNGQVVLHGQKNRKPSLTSNDPKPVLKPDPPVKTGCFGYSSESSGLMNRNMIHDNETASWLQYPIDDSLANEFCYDIFYEIPTSESVSIEKLNKEFVEGEKPTKFGPERRSQTIFKQSNNLHFAGNSIPESQALMPPPKEQITDLISRPPSPNLARNVNFSHFSRMGMTTKGDLCPSKELLGEKGLGNLSRVKVGESSMTTIGSSNCGSNQVENHSNINSISSNGADASTFVGAVGETAQKVPFRSNRREAIEPTVTSSSDGSGSSAGRTGKQISMAQNKRKSRDADESECQSEEAEYESAEANKPGQRSTSARRRRAAEVHNLSERRRRDRINEKMKALQELIPHCNKSDKASMLDEAIEYLKSLQLQVQIMWMGGSGMVPVMLPGVQHYLSPMGMGSTRLPPVNAPSQLPTVPSIDQSRAPVPGTNQLPMCLPPALNPVNFQNQIRDSNFFESYARYLSFMQTAPQAMNLFSYGSQPMQPNQMAAQPSSSTGPSIGGVLSESIQTGKAG